MMYISYTRREWPAGRPGQHGEGGSPAWQIIPVGYRSLMGQIPFFHLNFLQNPP